MANKELIFIVDYRKVMSVEDNLYVDKRERINGGRPQNTIKKFSEDMRCYLFCLGCQYIILICCRAFAGPTLGGFLNEKLGFEWAAAIQGGWALLSVSNYTFFAFISIAIMSYCMTLLLLLLQL